VNTQTDAELVALARSGDKAAFGSLIERYQGMAKRAAMRMVFHEDIAQELAQEAILRAYLALDNLRDDSSFKNWLYGIVLNVCRAYLRDRKVGLFPIEALADSLIADSNTTADPEQIVEENEVRRRVLAAVHDLSSENKLAVLLFYYEQLSLQEIANGLGISVVAVKGRLHKARRRLRTELSTLHANQRVMRKENTMIKVIIGDVIWMKSEDGNRCVILLLDELGQRALPIWVGSVEGELIARGVHSIACPRPLTFNFMASLLEASNAHLEEVRVEMLKDKVYYAVAKVRSSAAVREIDARPSDALSLAVLTQSPMFVSPEIPESVWLTTKLEGSEKPTLDEGTDAIMNEIRHVFEKQVASNEFLSASRVAQDENPGEYLKRLGFLSDDK
jgi:RNA polymerase sigma factor (sigma-70 family)